MSPVEQAEAEELAAIYAEELGQSPRVCLAFVKDGKEPPSGEQTKQRGFSSADLATLKRHYPYTKGEEF